MNYAVIDKKIGETPLEALITYKQEHGIPDSLPSCYAGRLDPMASGKLLVLFGEECKKLSKYTGLDKEYEIEVLVGIGSDTGDVLGIPERGESIKGEVKEALVKELGTYERPYPVFSSKTVNGKPLFLYALEKTLDSITIPTHPETIYAVRLIESSTVSHKELHTRVIGLLALAPTSNEPSKVLGADFRIGEVRPAWEKVLEVENMYQVHRVRVVCGSGTYMRTLAGRIGESLGSKALALSIRRSKIGSYFPPLRIWTRKY